MQRSAWVGIAGIASLLASSTACLEGTDDLVTRENRPVHVAVFDHVPTEQEIQAEQAQFLAAAQGELASATASPIDPRAPATGQKLVRIIAVTSNLPDSGTDDASAVRFTGRWLRSGSPVSDSFVLNNPDKDDLELGSFNLFYYLLNMGQGVQDQFVEGKISNSSTDAWRCTDIWLREESSSGAARTQSLPFNQLVDAPSRIDSAWLVANVNSLLTY